MRCVSLAEISPTIARDGKCIGKRFLYLFGYREIVIGFQVDARTEQYYPAILAYYWQNDDNVCVKSKCRMYPSCVYETYKCINVIIPRIYFYTNEMDFIWKY